jgi:tRNA-dihydrouridine synthase
MAQQCVERGYTEINLNLGCPSGTVTAKGKGAGMLQKLDDLDRFLDEIFNKRTADISIKTRIGFASSAEFPALVEIFKQYPIKELTIHPRVRNAFYNGEVEMDCFLYALHNSKLPLCYNGDITSKEQIRNLPPVESVMIGRGLIADPGMLLPNGTDKYVLQNFHDALLEAYIEAFGGSRNAMFRLKEHWQYLRKRLDSPEKLEKQLRKTTDLAEYKSITAQIFAQCHFKNDKA